MGKMSDTFDAIVVGAGMAGLCCAGTLVQRKDKRVLLISETAEVCHNLSSQTVGGCRGLAQWPTWTYAWGGGWWFNLARQLDVPIDMRMKGETYSFALGSRAVTTIGILNCATTVADLLLREAPPAAQALRPGLTAALQRAFEIPYPEMMTLNTTLLADWLKQHEVEEPVCELLFGFFSNVTMAASIEECKRNISVYGSLGHMRTSFGGEGTQVIVKPDAQLGLGVPLRRGFERAGGVVWSGKKVKRIIIEQDVVRAVEMEDGRIADAPDISLAVGAPRLRALLERLPEEFVQPLAYAQGVHQVEIGITTVLSRQVDWIGHDAAIHDGKGSNLVWVVPIYKVAPWTCPDGKIAIWADFVRRELSDFEGAKSVEEAIPVCNQILEQVYPGFKEATVAQSFRSHRHLWQLQHYAGPKVPLRIGSVQGLWYSGDYSVACVGGAGVESAACGGVRGAQALMETWR